MKDLFNNPKFIAGALVVLMVIFAVLSLTFNSDDGKRSDGIGRVDQPVVEEQKPKAEAPKTEEKKEEKVAVDPSFPATVELTNNWSISGRGRSCILTNDSITVQRTWLTVSTPLFKEPKKRVTFFIGNNDKNKIKIYADDPDKAQIWLYPARLKALEEYNFLRVVIEDYGNDTVLYDKTFSLKGSRDAIKNYENCTKS